ncbi:unnamed protein product [Sphenostylis stenocarpa]|uniref:Uncharacterized protein n=1 Tax=Sphenostylis stenocarpa TaxID=92480 RepID=A0AA86S9T5_9FABA|nr:unnamed protein product [Sphenostylis stenocarpa]
MLGNGTIDLVSGMSYNHGKGYFYCLITWFSNALTCWKDKGRDVVGILAEAITCIQNMLWLLLDTPALGLPLSIQQSDFKALAHCIEIHIIRQEK